MNDPYTNASEINTYLFCKRAWHLQRMGTSTSLERERQAGIEDHEHYGHAVAASGRNARVALWLAVITMILLAAAALL
jgi:hypothetical protein